jgi:ADP-heptose:LPS heptosyltransferase
MGTDRRRVALFEPWGLGDLAISLHLARAAAVEGAAVTLFCDSQYVEWAKTFPFVSEVIGVAVPWTQKDKKYEFSTYPWRDWRRIRKEFREKKFELVFEPRRDMRANLLLAYLTSGPRKRPSSRKEGLGYRRLALLPRKPDLAANRSGKKSIVFFFGAEWANRRVPDWKIPSLLDSVRASDRSIGVILPPQESQKEVYRTLRNAGVECIEGTVAEVSRRIADYSHAVSTDSGWLHVAHLAGLRTLGLFGFMNDMEWAPPGAAVLRSEHCLPGQARYRLECRDIQPLGTLRVQDFQNKVRELLGERE